MAHRVDQGELHDPANGAIGDCLRACLASLLELPLAAVPHFGRELYPSDDGELWRRTVNAWLRPRGRYLLPIGPGYEHVLAGCYLAIGPSPRTAGDYHVVVHRGGELWHDPHPSRAGLERVELYEVLVDLCGEGGA